jgi:hypothetical protein
MKASKYKVNLQEEKTSLFVSEVYFPVLVKNKCLNRLSDSSNFFPTLNIASANRCSIDIALYKNIKMSLFFSLWESISSALLPQM